MRRSARCCAGPLVIATVRLLWRRSARYCAGPLAVEPGRLSLRWSVCCGAGPLILAPDCLLSRRSACCAGPFIDAPVRLLLRRCRAGLPVVLLRRRRAGPL